GGRLKEIDAPPSIDAVDIAHVEAPALSFAHDRAALDGGAREVFPTSAPHGCEGLAVAASDDELATAPRPGPAQPIDQIDRLAVGESPRRAGHMPGPRGRRRRGPRARGRGGRGSRHA